MAVNLKIIKRNLIKNKFYINLNKFIKFFYVI